MSLNRTSGDDMIVRVRIRKANLAALEDGVLLGIDALTLGEITLTLVPREDGTHDLQVVTAELMMANAPEPVSPEIQE